MTIYAPSDVTSISVPGGCGQPHNAEGTPTGQRFAVTCATCEPLIADMRTGWAHTPSGVHLTPDEIAEVEAAEATAARERNRTWSHPDALAQSLRAALGQPQGSDVTETMAAMQAQITELSAKLAEATTKKPRGSAKTSDTPEA